MTITWLSGGEVGVPEETFPSRIDPRLRKMLLRKMPCKPALVDSAYGWDDKLEIFVKRDAPKTDILKVAEWWMCMTNKYDLPIHVKITGSEKMYIFKCSR